MTSVEGADEKWPSLQASYAAATRRIAELEARIKELADWIESRPPTDPPGTPPPCTISVGYCDTHNTWDCFQRATPVEGPDTPTTAIDYARGRFGECCVRLRLVEKRLTEIETTINRLRAALEGMGK